MLRRIDQRSVRRRCCSCPTLTARSSCPLLAVVEVPGLSLLSDFVDVEPADGNEDVDEAPEALELSRVLVVEPTSGDDDW